VADVFSFILSQSSSKFHQELVDSGLAYQVQFNYQTEKYVGPIQLFVVPNPAKIKECMKKVNELIGEFDSNNFFTDDQLQTAKDQLVIGQTYNSEKTSQFVHTISYNWASCTIDYYFTYADNLQKVTRQDIVAFVNKYIKGKPMVAGVLLSQPMQQQLGIKDFAQLMP
jgi:zinc protease